jgi:hypothetical protein
MVLFIMFVLLAEGGCFAQATFHTVASTNMQQGLPVPACRADRRGRKAAQARVNFIAELDNDPTLDPASNGQLLNFALSRAVNGTILFTMGSWAYAEQLMNWLVTAAAVGVLENVVVLVLDKPLHDMLTHRGFPSFYDPETYQVAAALFTSDKGRIWTECCQNLIPAALDSGKHFIREVEGPPMRNCCKKSYVWANRLSAVRTLLRGGLRVIQADNDALLLKHPITCLAPYIAAAERKEEGKGFDIIAQRGSFPHSLRQKWGATMSFGFMVFNPTPSTMAFIELGRTMFIEQGDDQQALQLALNGCTDMKWNLGSGRRPEPGVPLTSEEAAVSGLGIMDVGVSTFPVTDKGDTLAVLLLPNRVIVRRCNDSWTTNPSLFDDTIVAHCYKKIKKAKGEDGFYFLRNEWIAAKRLSGETSTQFFSRIGTGHPSLDAL